MSKDVWHLAGRDRGAILVIYSPNLEVAKSFKYNDAVFHDAEQCRKFIMWYVKSYYSGAGATEPLSVHSRYLQQCRIKCTFKVEL